MPKPKTGKAVPPTPPKKPGDVNLVAEVKAGAISAVKAAKAEKLKQAKFSPQKFKPNKPIPQQAPPEKKSEKPCGVGELILKDGQNRLALATGHILQVVPEAPGKETLTPEWLGIVDMERSKPGGEETLKAEVKSKTDGRKQACLLRIGSAGESSWKDGANQTFKLKAHPNISSWSKNVEPELYYVFGRGCDEAYTRFLVEVFPSRQHKVKIDVKELKELVQAMSGGFAGIIQHWIKPPSVMDKEELEEAKEDQNFEEGRSTKKEKTLKNVGFELEWGWKEDKKDWRVYYAVEIQAGCDPLLDFGWKPKISFAKIAYQALGCPPGVSDLIAEHVFDIYVQFEFLFNFKVMGTAKFHYYTYGENVHSGGIQGTGGGQLGVVLGAKAGSRWIVAFVMEGAGRSKIDVALAIEVGTDGVELLPEVTIRPLVVSFSIKMIAFRRTAHTFIEKEWEFGGPWEVYPRPKSKRIIWPKSHA